MHTQEQRGHLPWRRADPDRSSAAPPQCSHYFHLMCINTWLHNKNTCPICRRKWEFARREACASPRPLTRHAIHFVLPLLRCFLSAARRSQPQPRPAHRERGPRSRRRRARERKRRLNEWGKEAGPACVHASFCRSLILCDCVPLRPPPSVLPYSRTPAPTSSFVYLRSDGASHAQAARGRVGVSGLKPHTALAQR
jgi:hypothetical protein